MSAIRLTLLTAITMIAFAGNSLLCRAALAETHIDAASFTSIRLLSGALTLLILVWIRTRSPSVAGNWRSALALFVYAAGFSFAYIQLTAATGALLLFGAVQCTMIGYGLCKGERMNWIQILGVLVAVGGLIGLLLPGLSAPPLLGASLMLMAGTGWGVYSLRGRGTLDATRDTAGNFLRALPFALALSALLLSHANVDPHGAAFAFASGALASGLGYAIWYAVLPALKATSAATVQLSVPAIAAIGGALLIGEPITLRVTVSSVAILGGVAMFIFNKRRATNAGAPQRIA